MNKLIKWIFIITVILIILLLWALYESPYRCTRVAESQSSATNVSGFLDHEPETTLKFVKQGSTGSNDF